MQLIHYLKATGEIMGVYTADLREHLEANRRDDATHGSLLLEAAIPPMDHEQFAVVDGAVIAKQALTIVANPAPFPADGQTPCQITVEPFAPCMLLVNGEQVTLSASDPMLLLTADAPQQFVIQLVAMTGRWAAPLTVEAR